MDPPDRDRSCRMQNLGALTVSILVFLFQILRISLHHAALSYLDFIRCTSEMQSICFQNEVIGGSFFFFCQNISAEFWEYGTS